MLAADQRNDKTDDDYHHPKTIIQLTHGRYQSLPFYTFIVTKILFELDESGYENNETGNKYIENNVNYRINLPLT